MLKPGDQAPEFALPNADLEVTQSSDFRGMKNLVIYFYPKDDTPGCTLEAIEFTDLLDELDMIVHQASSGEDAVFLVEDYRPDLLIMEISLPDMHAWKLLVTLRERINIAGLPIIIIMDEHKVMPLDNITSIMRPVGLAQFRNTIRSLLNDNRAMDE